MSRQAKLEAKNVIEHLDPKYISGWNDLIKKLEIALKRVKEMKRHSSSSLKF